MTCVRDDNCIHLQLEDSSIDRHRDDRKAVQADDASDVTSVISADEQEIVVSDDGRKLLPA